MLRPIHRADVEFGIRRKARDAFAREPDPGLGVDHRLQPEIGGGPVDPRAVPVEIGRDALEGARAVEDRRAEPGRMGARPHDRRIAVVPLALEEGPGLGIADGFVIWAMSIVPAAALVPPRFITPILQSIHLVPNGMKLPQANNINE